MLRKGWQGVLAELQERRKMIVQANAAVATVAGYDGVTLELMFPPGRTFAAEKVEQKQADLLLVLDSMFGISPKLKCTVREGVPADPAFVEPEVEAPATPVDAEELLKSSFGAEVIEEKDD